MENRKEVATVAGGCFWCLEAAFEQLEGVSSVISGYVGGSVPDPSYAQVSAGQTGHAEAVQVTFQPEIITYRELLEVFFTVHDPTTLNRQGADVGTQYRSAIFYHTPQQKAEAERTINELQSSKLWKKPFVTEIKALTTFYEAEEHHQNYYSKHQEHGYCQLVINPKLAKLRKNFARHLRKPIRASGVN